MKVKLLNILAVAIALMLLFVSSGMSKPVNGYLYGGISSPRGKISGTEITDIWKRGFTFGGSVGISMMSRVELLVTYDFHSFPLKDVPVVLFSGNMNTTMYGIGAKVNFGIPMTSFNPYLMVGIGRASFSVSLPVGNLGIDLDTKTFYQYGGGVEFGHFFLQGKYITMSSGDSKRNYLPITLGFKI